MLLILNDAAYIRKAYLHIHLAKIYLPS